MLCGRGGAFEGGEENLGDMISGWGADFGTGLSFGGFGFGWGDIGNCGNEDVSLPLRGFGTGFGLGFLGVGVVGVGGNNESKDSVLFRNESKVNSPQSSRSFMALVRFVTAAKTSEPSGTLNVSRPSPLKHFRPASNVKVVRLRP